MSNEGGRTRRGAGRTERGMMRLFGNGLGGRSGESELRGESR